MSALIVMGLVLVAVVVIGPIIGLAMGLVELLITVLFWMLAGMLAGRLLRGRGYGPVDDVLLGLAGGFVGSVALSLVNLGGIGSIWLVGNLIVGVIGAVLLVWLIRTLGNKDFAR